MALSSATPVPSALASATRPERITDSRPGTPSTESALEGERVHIGVVDAAINNVDLDRAFGGAHPDIAVAHEEVAALDELDAHLLGEEDVLEIGAVVAAGREQDDDRVAGAAGRHRAQILQEPLGVVADRRDALPVERVGEEPHHDLAVLEHVGHARRRAHIVLEHEEVALAGADQVDAGDMRIDVVRRLECIISGRNAELSRTSSSGTSPALMISWS